MGRNGLDTRPQLPAFGPQNGDRYADEEAYTHGFTNAGGFRINRNTEYSQVPGGGAGRLAHLLGLQYESL